MSKTYAKFLDQGNAWKRVDLSGCWERSVKDHYREKFTRGPGGPMTLTDVIRTVGGIYLLRGKSLARRDTEYLVRIPPETAASWLIDAGHFDLPPDLDEYAAPCEVEPPTVPFSPKVAQPPTGDEPSDQVSRDAKTKERDLWILEKERQRVPRKTIERELKQLAPERGWRTLSESGIRQVIREAPKKYNVPPVPMRKAGRGGSQ